MYVFITWPNNIIYLIHLTYEGLNPGKSYHLLFMCDLLKLRTVGNYHLDSHTGLSTVNSPLTSTTEGTLWNIIFFWFLKTAEVRIYHKLMMQKEIFFPILTILLECFSLLRSIFIFFLWAELPWDMRSKAV